MSAPPARRVEFFRHTLGKAELASLRRTFDTLFVAQGPRVACFERALGSYLGAPHVVGVSSCSSGLILALRAVGVGPGDEVITTSMTYVATSNAVLHLGATPVFVDVDPQTGLIDPGAVEAAVGARTRAILPVHLYGQMADMRRLGDIARRHRLGLVEDAAHAVEAERDGARPASIGDAAVFSFYATKSITSGDGGAIAVRDREVAERLRRLRNFGITRDAATRHGKPYAHWDMVELGYKASLTDISAAILEPQIAQLDARQARRQELVERYQRLLADVGGVRFLQWSGRSAHLLFTVLVDPARRDQVLAGLDARGIGCAVNYRAVHTLRYYRERLPQPPGALPHATDIGERTITLPLWPAMQDGDVDTVVEALVEALDEAGA